MATLGDHAIVLGASMGGLLAARVLSDSYRTVTVVERDILPEDPVNRRGTPQARHVHGLLGRGGQIIDELFPGFLGELVATTTTPGPAKRQHSGVPRRRRTDVDARSIPRHGRSGG